MPTFRSPRHPHLRIHDLGVKFADGLLTVPARAKEQLAGLRALVERGEHGITEEPSKPAAAGATQNGGDSGDDSDPSGPAGDAG